STSYARPWTGALRSTRAEGRARSTGPNRSWHSPRPSSLWAFFSSSSRCATGTLGLNESVRARPREVGARRSEDLDDLRGLFEDASAMRGSGGYPEAVSHHEHGVLPRDDHRQRSLDVDRRLLPVVPG